MSEGDRRSAKLHKQTEVDDDSEESISTPPPPPPSTTTTIASQSSSGVPCRNLCNIPTPTVVPASSSSSSETSPEDPTATPPPPQPPATLSRKQTLTRTPAFEGTSPPPESFLVHHDPSSDHPSSSSSTTTTTIISGGRSNGGSGSRSIIPSISTTSPPLVTTSTQPLPNGGTVTVSTLSVTSDAMSATSASGSGRIKGTSAAHQAKEFLLASHTVSNDSGRGTLDDTSDVLQRECSVDTSANLSSPSTSSPPTSSTPTLASPAYTDSTGTDLIPFFKSTLRKSAKDKKTLLAVEREMIAFIGDMESQSHKMNEMNPYDRMVAHRVAAYYGLDHNVDQSGKCIIVTRTAKTRMPDLKLCDIPNTLEEKRILLKKPSSLDEQQVKRLTTKDKFGTNRAKSLEERQQNYHEVRERIFKVDESPIVSKEGQSTSISSSNLLTHPSFQQHHHHHPPMSQQRSLDSMRDARQQQQQHNTPHHHLHHHSFSRPLWSSTDSSGYGTHQTQALSQPDVEIQQHGLSDSNITTLSQSSSSTGQQQNQQHQQQHYLLSTTIPTSLSSSTHSIPGGFSGQQQQHHHQSSLLSSHSSSSSLSGDVNVININANSSNVSNVSSGVLLGDIPGVSVSVPSMTVAAAPAAAVAANQPSPQYHLYNPQVQQPQQPQLFQYHQHHCSSPTTGVASTSLLSASGLMAESLGGPSLYESPPSHPSAQELSNTPTGSVSDQSPVSRPASETGHSPLTQPPPYPTVTYLVPTDLASKAAAGTCIINPETMQPHVNPDGTLYQYDVSSCPPPFMMAATQPTASTTQIPAAGFVYQADPVYDLTSRFAGTSLTPVEGVVAGGPDHMTLGLQPGQTVSLVPSPGGQASNLIQTQYINGSQVVGPQVRYICTLPPTGGIHQQQQHHHLTAAPTPGSTVTGTPVVLDTTNPTVAHPHPHHQVTAVVPMPPTAVAANPAVPQAATGSAGSYQIISHHPTTAYIQTPSGVNAVSITPVPTSGSVGGSYPIDLSTLTPEQQQSVLAAAAAGGGTIICNNQNLNPSQQQQHQTLPASAMLNHPQSIPHGAGGALANPQAAGAIPVSAAPSVIQAYTIAPYPHLSNVATVPISQQQQQQHHQLLQQQLQHQSSLTHHHHHHHQQQQHQPPSSGYSNNTHPSSSLPPPSSSNSAAAAAAFFTGVPLTNTSNSPSPLSQSQNVQTQPPPPPPPHPHHNHHQPPPHHQQPAVVYNIGGVPMISTLPPTSLPPPPLSSKSNTGTPSVGQFSSTSSSSSSSYQQTPPPGAPTMQIHPHHHHHHPHPQHHQQSSSSSSMSSTTTTTSSSSSSSNNGYHHHHHQSQSHPHSYTQSPSAITFIPNPPQQQQQQTTQTPQGVVPPSAGNASPQLVTIPTVSGYHPQQLRPVGIIPMAGAATSAAPTHFQLVRPTGSMQDVRMLQPGAFPTRLPGVPLYGSFTAQGSRPRGSNPNRLGKGSKKYGSRDSGNGQAPSPLQQPQPQLPQQQQRKQQPMVATPAGPPPPPSPQQQQQQQQQQHHIVTSSGPAGMYPSPLLPPASCRP